MRAAHAKTTLPGTNTSYRMLIRLASHKPCVLRMRDDFQSGTTAS